MVIRLIRPQGDDVLYPGDKILLVGSANQIDGVHKLPTTCDVSRGANADVTGMVLDVCRVGTGLAGNTLGELNLPTHFGVYIVGIHRGEHADHLDRLFV